MNTSLLDANVSQNGHIAMWFADLVEPFHLKTVVSLQAYGKGNHGCAADYTIEPRRWKLNSNPLTSQIFDRELVSGSIEYENWGFMDPWIRRVENFA